jgi:hypothetical protein
MDTMRRTPVGPPVKDQRNVSAKTAANILLDTLYEQTKPYPWLHQEVTTLLGHCAGPDAWSHVFQVELDDLTRALAGQLAADKFTALMT